MIFLYFTEECTVVINSNPKKQSSNGQHLVYKYMIAASLAALVISTFASWFFYSKWEESEDRYIELLKQKNQLSQELTVLRSEFEDAFSELIILHDVNFKAVSLTSKDTVHKFQARIYWNPYTRETYLDPLSVPQPDSGMQYQIWSFVNKTASSSGLLQPEFSGDQLYRINNTAAAESWAISLEPAGGSPEFSAERVVLIQR